MSRQKYEEVYNSLIPLYSTHKMSVSSVSCQPDVHEEHHNARGKHVYLFGAYFKTILALMHVTLLSGSVRLQWWSSVAIQL